MYNICEQSILRGGRIAPLILPFKVTNGTGLTNPTIIKIREKLYVKYKARSVFIVSFGERTKISNSIWFS